MEGGQFVKRFTDSKRRSKNKNIKLGYKTNKTEKSALDSFEDQVFSITPRGDKDHEEEKEE